MITGVGETSPRWVLHRHGRYLRSVTLWPGSSLGADVGVVETDRATAAVRLCTKRNAMRLAALVNMHEPYKHLFWEVVKL